MLRDVVGAPGARTSSLSTAFSGSGGLRGGAPAWAEGIVSKRAGSPDRAGANRDWLKTKVNATGVFVITGFARREAVAVAELEWRAVPLGQVKSVSAARRWGSDWTGCAAAPRPVPTSYRVRQERVAEMKFFGRYRGADAMACCRRSAEHERCDGMKTVITLGDMEHHGKSSQAATTVFVPPGDSADKGGV